MRFAEGFKELLASFNLDALENHAGAVYGTSADLRLAFFNRGWEAFAAANGGDLARYDLGASLLSAMTEPLLTNYQRQFSRVLREGRPWEHVYECSSPDQERMFHMLVYPLRERRGLLFVHSLRFDHAIDGPKCEQCDALYRDCHGLIHQCAHCRRVRRIDLSETWDWVPALVRANDPYTSHGVCQPCYGFYYSPERMLADELPKSISTIHSQ